MVFRYGIGYEFFDDGLKIGQGTNGGKGGTSGGRTRRRREARRRVDFDER